jgi:hypothetical protein
VVHLRQAALQRHVDAMLLLGRCLRDGVGTDINSEDALFWLERAAMAGSGPAQLDSAMMLLAQGNNGVNGAVSWLKQAARNGIDEAAQELRQLQERLGLNKQTKTISDTPVSSAHLDIDHELHAKNGRLRVSLLCAEGMPKLSMQCTWNSKKKKKILVHPRIYVEMEFGEGSDDQDVRWVRVIRRPRASASVNLDDIREIPMLGTWVESHAASAKFGAQWNTSFAAYINGSSGCWKTPLNVRVYAKVGGWLGSVLIGTGQVMPWEIPAGRRTRTWIDIDVLASDNMVLVNKKSRVLVEFRRSTARYPQYLLETEEQKKIGRTFKWNIMQVRRHPDCQNDLSLDTRHRLLNYVVLMFF